MSSLLCLNLARLNRLGPRPQFPSKPKTVKFSTLVRASFENSEGPTNHHQQQLNLSVLRFTLGIPGLDESYLPRWIGYGFGSLLLLNRFVGSDSTSTTSAQIITEVLGLSLASFSVFIPYLGKFLKGAQRMDQATLPEESDQIFIMSQNIPVTQKDDMAWASYVLLRNTNAIAVLISIRGRICVRGYWNIPHSLSKENLLTWFEEKMKFIGLSDLKDALYFPKDGGDDWIMQGSCSFRSLGFCTKWYSGPTCATITGSNPARCFWIGNNRLTWNLHRVCTRFDFREETRECLDVGYSFSEPYAKFCKEK